MRIQHRHECLLPRCDGGQGGTVAPDKISGVNLLREDETFLNIEQTSSNVS